MNNLTPGFVALSITMAAAASAQTTSTAPAYPAKPVRIIAASTGTSGDLLARYLGLRRNLFPGPAIRYAGH